MPRNLTLAVAVTLVLTMSPGRADEQKPQEAKKAQGIQAEVRGTLHFESGRGYFISVKPADKTEQEMRVWLATPEDKVLIRKLEGLDGKEVIAKGKLAQMSEGVRGSSVPPLGIYLHHGFEIEHTGANLNFSAAPRHQPADKKPTDHKVTEIRLERSGGKESGPQDVLTLRADGTAIYEGKKNVERVGRHIGKLPRHGFHDSFPLLAEMYVSLGRQGGTAGKPTESVTKITLTVIRNGKPEEVEDWCPGIDRRLWALEMAIRGVAADIRWEKAEGK